MANRRYTDFKDRAICCKTSPPPNGRKGPKATLPKESTAKWPGMNKEGRSSRDRGLGMKPVKTFVAGAYMPMGSSNWIAGAIKKPGALKRSLGVPTGQTIPPMMLGKAAKASGVMGARARLAQTLNKLRG